uniref:RNase H type-1 domain-containing protein n=1 Tax=Manihot esculenta TaxID=3983 RepID=A0A2C9U0G2_MANES
MLSPPCPYRPDSIGFSSFGRWWVKPWQNFHNLVNLDEQFWCLPPQGILKFNYDVAKKSGSNQAAIAVIVRNHRTRVVDRVAKSCSCLSVVAGEVLAVLEALNLAKKKGDLLKTKQNECQWNIKATDCAILLLSQDFVFIDFVFVSRVANHAANNIAKLCLSGSLSCNWLACQPISFLKCLDVDIQSAL